MPRVTYLGATVLAGSPADFGRLIADESEKWGKVVKFAGLKPDNPTSTTPFGESDLPVFRALSLCACCRPYPGAATGRIASLTAPSRISLPRYGSRVGLRIVLFEACSAFTRVTACTLALSPYIVTRYPKASATSLPP